MTTTLGMTGGMGGKQFDGYAIPDGARIVALHLFSQNFINGLQVVLINAKGDEETMPLIGRSVGDLHTVTFAKGEYLTGIHGRAGWYVDSLCVRTNKGTSESFGGDGGEYEFDYSAEPNSEIVGFFGRADHYLDALGIITRERPQPKTAPKTKPDDLKLVNGIGPKLEEVLKGQGMLTLLQMSQTPLPQLQELVHHAGEKFRLCDPETWAEQAGLILEGKLEEAHALFTRWNEARQITKS